MLARLKRPDRAHDPPQVHARYQTIAEGAATGLGGDRYYGYEPDLVDLARANLAEHGVDPEQQTVELIEGLVQDTMVVDAPVALAHIDVDWHEPVAVCLERIAPHLAVGGRIGIDDYHGWGGCRTATGAFLAGQPPGLVADDSAGSIALTCVRA